MDIEKFRYHSALAELEKAARVFALAMALAAEAAKDVEGDDPEAVRVLGTCRAALAAGFQQAPGMIQLFTPESE